MTTVARVGVTSAAAAKPATGFRSYSCAAGPGRPVETPTRTTLPLASSLASIWEAVGLDRPVRRPMSIRD